MTEIAAQGRVADRDTLERQERSWRWSGDEGWARYWRAAAATPGMEGWGAFIDGTLAAFLVTVRFDDCVEFLLARSRSDSLDAYPNNALIYTVAQEMLVQRGVRRITFGLESLESVQHLDEFKFGMGFRAAPLRQRIVFHPLAGALLRRGMVRSAIHHWAAGRGAAVGSGARRGCCGSQRRAAPAEGPRRGGTGVARRVRAHAADAANCRPRGALAGKADGTEAETRAAFLPFPSPVPIGEEEIAAVVDTLRSGWLSMGPKAVAFEERFAAAVGAPHGVAVSSATAGLHLGLDALGIGPGDEVLVPTLTFTSTAATVLHVGATPRLVDCEPDTLNMCPADAARKWTPRTKLIVPVHFGGHPCDMDALQALAAPHGTPVMEDAAHALPASYRGRKIGSLADLTVFSFYATKNLTTGEGGMVTTADGALADRIRQRRLHGMTRDAWKRYSDAGSWRYDVAYPGFKYNMTDINAALGLVQLRRLRRDAGRTPPRRRQLPGRACTTSTSWSCRPRGPTSTTPGTCSWCACARSACASAATRSFAS